LKSIQSCELNAPLLVALAVGKLNVCVSVPVVPILKSEPVVPTWKYCAAEVNPSNVASPVVKVVCTLLKCIPCVCNVMVLPEVKLEG